jgi:hypothetical protein
MRSLGKFTISFWSAATPLAHRCHAPGHTLLRTTAPSQAQLRKFTKWRLGIILGFCGVDTEDKFCDDIADPFRGHKFNCHEAAEREAW